MSEFASEEFANWSYTKHSDTNYEWTRQEYLVTIHELGNGEFLVSSKNTDTGVMIEQEGFDSKQEAFRTVRRILNELNDSF